MTLSQLDPRRINGPRPVGHDVLDAVGFTDHALERFATRAGLSVTDRPIVEPILRDLLLQEGPVVDERPRWARSRNSADLYLQLGEWMLLIGMREAHRATGFAIVTVVNGPNRNTWREALRRGYIFTPPPPMITGRGHRRPSLLVSVAAAVRGRRYARARVRARRRHLARYRLG